MTTPPSSDKGADWNQPHEFRFEDEVLQCQCGRYEHDPIHINEGGVTSSRSTERDVVLDNRPGANPGSDSKTPNPPSSDKGKWRERSPLFNEKRNMAIVALIEKGISCQMVAKRFNISFQRVQQIYKNVTGKHVEVRRLEDRIAKASAELKPALCLICGLPILDKPTKYCSRQCHASMNSLAQKVWFASGMNGPKAKYYEILVTHLLQHRHE